MIDTDNTDVREILTPDGRKTLVQYVYEDGKVIALHATGSGKIGKYPIGDCEEIIASPSDDGAQRAG